VSDHRTERYDTHRDAPLRRRTDTDPENVEWWTNLPDLVDRLERALREAGQAITELRAGRDANRRRIDDSRKFLTWLLVGAVAFNVATMLLFGYLFDERDEQRERDIRTVRSEFFAQCRDINANAVTINDFIDAQQNAVRTNPVRTRRGSSRTLRICGRLSPSASHRLGRTRDQRHLQGRHPVRRGGAAHADWRRDPAPRARQVGPGLVPGPRPGGPDRPSRAGRFTEADRGSTTRPAGGPAGAHQRGSLMPNNGWLWTVVAVLAIVALLIFIFANVEFNG
jgi:hypothetical protein